MAAYLAETATVSDLQESDSPIVTIGSSSYSVTASGSYTLSVSATDSAGIVKVIFKRNGTQIAIVTGAPYTITESVTQANNGTFVYTATAYDAAGGFTTSSPVSVVISIGSGSLVPDFFVTPARIRNITGASRVRNIIGPSRVRAM
jgi:chitinase